MFGMGTGGTLAVWSPVNLRRFKKGVNLLAEILARLNKAYAQELDALELENAKTLQTIHLDV